MPRRILALALCRVSSIEQLENNSLNRQRGSVLKAAEKLGVEIAEDGWWSGSVSSKRGTNIDRKDLQEMLDRCKNDKRVKYIIVDEVDRFMRSMLEIGYFLVEFKRQNVQVVFASQPDLKTDTATDTLMLMLEAFKAEGSNEERQRKSISGQTKALQEGRYPFAPKPGYMRGYERSIPEIHPSRGPALQKVLKRLAQRLVTPTQALAELNNSEFTNGHSPYKMDKFRRIVTDPFYAGILIMNKQVKVLNENGLHKPLISIDEHETLVRIMNSKKKNQSGPRKNGNPEFPCNNIVWCEQCLARKYSRFVGFNHSNGKSNKIYKRYRCRACGLYLKRDDLHEMILQEFERNPITKEGRAELMEALRIVWQEREKQAEQGIGRIEHRIVSFKRQISNHVDALLDPTNSSIKGEILEAVEKKKEELKELEEQLYNLKNNSHEDYERFLAYAFDFIEDIGGKFLDESTSQENRLRCKQIIFPSGFYVNENKKVYTPEKSILITLLPTKKSAEALNNSHLVRVTRL